MKVLPFTVMLFLAACSSSQSPVEKVVEPVIEPGFELTFVEKSPTKITKSKEGTTISYITSSGFGEISVKVIGKIPLRFYKFDPFSQSVISKSIIQQIGRAHV